MGKAGLASVRATVYGYVQGVFFRAFVFWQASELGLSGYVRNLPDGSVEVHAEGERSQLEKLISYLHTGPPVARVERVETVWLQYVGIYPGFNIRY